MYHDRQKSLCWMEFYRAALKRRRGMGWRRGRLRFIPSLLDRLNRTMIAIGMIFAAALLLALLVPV
ncbi:MAG TPA: hypothetical protein VHJ20_16090 [Polyangia bacterium]|nr:hypothetical protein [Polyangia bacterium]